MFIAMTGTRKCLRYVRSEKTIALLRSYGFKASGGL
jgi:hypothetical protein